MMSIATSSIDDAFSIAKSLTAEQKLELISRLWESVRLAGGFRPSESDIAEIKRRSAELDSGAIKGIPWEVVRDSVRSRIVPHE